MIKRSMGFMSVLLAMTLGSFTAFSAEQLDKPQPAGTNDRSSVSLERFSLTENGAVYDAKTKLEWMPVGRGKLTFLEATEQCASLGDGWRIPPAGAVQTLYKPQEGLHVRCGNYTCQVHPLIKLKLPQVWVDQIADHNKNQAWVADMGTGRGYTTSKGSRHATALCARGKANSN